MPLRRALALGPPAVWGAVAVTYKLVCPLTQRHGLGPRAATGAVFLGVGTGLVLHVRRTLLRELRQARQVAGAAQNVLLRPPPPRVDGPAVAAAQLSADRGASIGGDLYEVVATAHGVRIVMLPDETLVPHTDGAEDTRDARGRFFSLSAALSEAVRAGPAAEPRAVLGAVFTALLRHAAGTPADDVALLVLRNDRARRHPAAARDGDTCGSARGTATPAAPARGTATPAAPARGTATPAAPPHGRGRPP
jgi:hypothetical protein